MAESRRARGCLAPVQSYWMWKGGRRVRRVLQEPRGNDNASSSSRAKPRTAGEEQIEAPNVVVEYAPRLELVFSRSHRQGPSVRRCPRLGAKYHPVPRGARIPVEHHWTTTLRAHLGGKVDSPIGELHEPGRGSASGEVDEALPSQAQLDQHSVVPVRSLRAQNGESGFRPHSASTYRLQRQQSQQYRAQRRHTARLRPERMVQPAGGAGRTRQPGDGPLEKHGVLVTSPISLEGAQRPWAGGMGGGSLSLAYPEVGITGARVGQAESSNGTGLQESGDVNECSCQFSLCPHSGREVSVSGVGARPAKRLQSANVGRVGTDGRDELQQGQSRFQRDRRLRLKQRQREKDKNEFIRKWNAKKYRDRTAANNAAVFHRGLNVG